MSTTSLGAICAHTHLYSGLAPLGMPAPSPPPENFVQILERVWWRLDRALDEASLRASARLYIAEALLSGTTALIDHHESPAFIEGSLDVLADAAQELGVRALVCYGATERNGGEAEGRRGLDECARFIRSNQRPLVVGCLALHASFTVGDATIRRAGALCRELSVPMHVHLAEDGADVADAIERGYAGPLERLLALDALPAGSIAAHGVHLSPEQVASAAEHGVWFVHNPRSNKGNAVGYAANLIATDRVGLGTDGYPAKMADEQAALKELATDWEAESLRLERGRDLARELFGQGVDADMVTRDTNGAVDSVVVAGRQVVQDGALVSGDLEAIRQDAAQQAALLWERMAKL